MKKIFFIVFSLVLIFGACSDSNKNELPDPDPNPNGEGEEKENPYKTGPNLSLSASVEWENKGIDDAFFMLGYGYDATGKYAHPSSIRNKVIDFDKYAEEYKDRVMVGRYPSNGSDIRFSGTIQECIEDMATKANFTEEEIGKYKNLFRKTFDNPFLELDTRFPELTYYYAGVSQVVSNYLVSFLFSEKRFNPEHLSDELKSDLLTKSGDEIIEQYGTHVLSAIIVGERIDYLYKSTSKEPSKWLYYNANNYFSPSPSTWVSKPEDDTFHKENMYVEVVDGTHPRPNAWMLDITNYEGEPTVFGGWNSITDKNATLVNFRQTSNLIPIYKLVSDVEKKEEVRQAYEKYLTE